MDKRKAIAMLIALSISLTGCASEKNETESPKETDKNIEQQDPVQLGDSAINNFNEGEIKPTSEINSEETAVNYFVSEPETISNLDKLQTKEEIQQEVTEYLKTVVDFVFDGKEINGVTYDELSDQSKVAIIESIETTNGILEDSGLKDIAIVKGNDAKEWSLEAIKTGTELSKIVLKDLMTEETYEKASQIAEEAQDRVSNAYEDVKKYIKENKE